MTIWDRISGGKFRPCLHRIPWRWQNLTDPWPSCFSSSTITVASYIFSHFLSSSWFDNFHHFFQFLNTWRNIYQKNKTVQRWLTQLQSTSSLKWWFFFRDSTSINPFKEVQPKQFLCHSLGGGTQPGKTKPGKHTRFVCVSAKNTNPKPEKTNRPWKTCWPHKNPQGIESF